MQGKALRTIPEYLLNAAAGSSSEKGITFYNNSGQRHRVPYSGLASSVARAAKALSNQGLVKGDRLLLVLPDPEEFTLSFFGALHAGIVPVPLAQPFGAGHVRGFEEHVLRVQEKAESAMLITSKELLSALPKSLPGKGARVVCFESLPMESEEAPMADITLDDLAFLQFTSGSTKSPRGVAVKHCNLAENIYCINALGYRTTSDDKSCSWLPLYHDMGLIGFLLSPVVAALEAVVAPPIHFLRKPKNWLTLITEHRSSITFAPNSAYGLCVKRIPENEMSGLDLSSLRIAGCGAEPIDYFNLKSFADKFAAIGFREKAFFPAYGMAESTLAVSFTALENPVLRDIVKRKELVSENRAVRVRAEENDTLSIVNCGKPFIGHDIRILNERGELCQDREVGELYLTGPSVMSGYFRDEEATAKVLDNGWLKTGDLGYFVDGDLHLCGRKKEIVIVCGKNYYPTDIEWEISELEGVIKGNVIAFSVQEGIARPEKVVICAETNAPKELFSSLEQRVKKQVLEGLGLRVDLVILLPRGTLPKTSSGKLQRTKAKDLFSKGKLVCPLEARLGCRLLSRVRSAARGIYYNLQRA